MKIEDAAETCKVRGYIAQASQPETKIWKNTMGFDSVVMDLMSLGADDWETFDPEGEATSIVG